MFRQAVAVAVLVSPSFAMGAMKVTVHTDDSRAVRAVIPTSGGTLTATSASGAKFTLVIPAHALVSGETITMTPIASIDHLPLSGGIVAAVQLEPNGLRLFQPATLTITTPSPIPRGLESPISWHGSGNDLHNYPLHADPNSIAFDLLHFSGAGVGSGSSSDRAAIQNSAPCDKEAALSQQIAAIFQAERERVQSGQPPDPTIITRAMTIMKAYYTQTIAPMMTAALQSKDDAQLQSAAVRALSWARQAALLGGEGDPEVEADTTAIFNFLAQALKEASDLAFDKCVKEHKPEYLKRMLSLEAQAQLLGVTGLGTEAKLDQCGQFELQFDSNFDKVANLDGGGGVSFKMTETMHGTATVPIKFTILEQPSGSAPLNYTFSAKIEAPSPVSCTTTNVTSTAGPLVVVRITPKLNVKEAEDTCGGGKRRAIGRHDIGSDAADVSGFELESMVIEIPNTTESATATCSVSGIPGTTLPLTFDGEFSGSWHDLHAAENIGGNRYDIRNWSTGTGSLLARKTYQQSATHGPATWNEVTTLDFFHRP